MITDDIQKELRSKYNPDGSDLRKQQLRMLEMLKQFDRFCKDFKITYWLTAGTLLGAVRHKGFIPWDDDLDLDVLRSDYEKLVSHRHELKKYGLILQDFKSDSEYIAPFAKLRDTKSEIHEIHHNDLYYKYRGIWIDIFVRERTSFITSKISHILQYISYKLTKFSNAAIRKYFKVICYNCLHNGIFPLLTLSDKLLYHSKKYRYEMGYGFYDYIYLDDTLPTKLIEFENGFFPAPKNYDKILKDRYGDYKQLPSCGDFKVHYDKILFFD